MIEVDVHHNHPIIKGFVRILKDEVADSKARRAAEEAEKNGPDPEKGKHIFLWQLNLCQYGGHETII